MRRGDIGRSSRDLSSHEGLFDLLGKSDPWPLWVVAIVGIAMLGVGSLMVGAVMLSWQKTQWIRALAQRVQHNERGKATSNFSRARLANTGHVSF